MDEVPEPREFAARVRIGEVLTVHEEAIEFTEPRDKHGHAMHRDHNLRSAFVRVVGDAAVSVLAFFGLLVARYLGWVWMNPVMGFVGAGVIAAWAHSLGRDTARVLVNATPDTTLEERIRSRIETDGDAVSDLHLWRLGLGHLGAIVSVVTRGAAIPNSISRRCVTSITCRTSPWKS